MWLLTTLGFFSVVAHHDDPGTVVVRARAREDLERLTAAHMPGAQILETPERDYRYRVLIARADWSRAAQELADAIDYGNFKAAVAERDGEDRAGVYGRVWSDLRTIQRTV